MLTRRFFIGGAASCLALGPNRIFAASNGAFSQGRPNLTFGVVSDVHIGLRRGAKKFQDAYTTETLKATLTRFRDAGADAVVIAGDMAHYGVGPELLEVGKTWFEVFPNGCAPDGRKVEPVFVMGNHDNGKKRAKHVYSDAKDCEANQIANNKEKWWDLAFHEEWKPIYRKDVKGYTFVGVHWVIGDCRGSEERFNSGIPDWYAQNGSSLDPSRPFFHIQHPHPKGTVHGPTVWGQDNGQSTQALMSYSNAIAFSGHSHISLTDERSIWQGGFTSVGCGTLRNVSLTTPGLGLPPAGYENYKTPDKTFKTYDAVKAMNLPARFECKQEQLLRVFDDRVVFSRRESIGGEALGPDLVMPLPAAERRPFDHKLREAKAMAPEFPAGAALSVKRTKGKLRGTEANRNQKADVWEISIPCANAVRNARAAKYDIVATLPDGTKESFAIINPGFRFPAGSKRGNEGTVCRIACSRIAAEHFSVQVRAVSCWGRVSAPLEGKA